MWIIKELRIKCIVLNTIFRVRPFNSMVIIKQKTEFAFKISSDNLQITNPPSLCLAEWPSLTYTLHRFY